MARRGSRSLSIGVGDAAQGQEAGRLFAAGGRHRQVAVLGLQGSAAGREEVVVWPKAPVAGT